jgi:transcriptional regulator with XRE-family HTH domain
VHLWFKEFSAVDNAWNGSILYRIEYYYSDTNMKSSEKQITREKIAKVVHALRESRHFTQTDMAKALGMSQGRYSIIERGLGSFTAEQFLMILRTFNVPASHFAVQRGSAETDMQNALSRWGARHLVSDNRVLPSQELEEVENLVQEVLIAGEPPRQVTALAPVLVQNLARLNLNKLWAEFVGYGLERRLAWLLDSTREAINTELARNPKGKHTGVYKRVEFALRLFLKAEPRMKLKKQQLWRSGQNFKDFGNKFRWDLYGDGEDGLGLQLDILGMPILSEKTLNEVLSEMSDTANVWAVATAIKPEDFIEALRTVHESD